MAWKEYVKGVKKLKSVPDDPYKLSYALLESDEINIDEATFTSLINKHILLANLDNDRLMRFYQNDAYFITNLFRIAKKDKSLKPVFNTIYTSWLMELAITRAKKGLERQYQNPFGNRVSSKSLSGFGKDIKIKEDEQAQYIIYE